MTFPSQSSSTVLPSFPFHSAVIACYADCDATATDIQDLEEYLLPAGVTVYSVIGAVAPGEGEVGGPGAGDGPGDGDDDGDDDDGALDNLPDFPPDDGADDGDDDDGEGE